MQPETLTFNGQMGLRFGPNGFSYGEVPTPVAVNTAPMRVAIDWKGDRSPSLPPLYIPPAERVKGLPHLEAIPSGPVLDQVQMSRSMTVNLEKLPFSKQYGLKGFQDVYF